jgi:hypothetical protein
MRQEKNSRRCEVDFFNLYCSPNLPDLFAKTPSIGHKDYLPSYRVISREKADGIQKTKGQTTYYTTYKPISEQNGVSRKPANPLISLVPRAGLEPARAISPGDFKSPVSTSSTTQAYSAAQ